ncbi:hypothetical protein C8J57DRAFT_1475186 [Mycena rebaudengoi]|nr:hypothetical protein C8J57DRAFT_1475186 [Mycena rebaudengoi]
MERGEPPRPQLPSIPASSCPWADSRVPMGSSLLLFHIFLAWWCITVNGVPQNFTVEDTDPSVRYLVRDTGDVDLDIRQVSPSLAQQEACSNNTCIACNVASQTRVELKFSGTAFYVATVMGPGPVRSFINIDGVAFAYNTQAPNFINASVPIPRSNFFYGNNALANGSHIVLIDVETWEFHFDYFIYTLDTDTILAGSTASAPISTTNSADTPTQTSLSVTAKKKTSVAPIAGGVVAGVLFLSLAVGIFLYRRSRRWNERKPIVIPAREKGSPKSNLTAPMTQHPPQLRIDMEPAPPLEEEVRLLREKVQRLEANTAAVSDSAAGSSVTRSLSTMKTEQTRALHEGHRVYRDVSEVRDSLVETDSGLRLMADVVGNPPPPLYQAD